MRPATTASIPTRRGATATSLALFLVGSLGSTAFAGDTDDAARSSRLELLPAPLGGASGIDLRTHSPNSPFVLFLGTSIQALDPDGSGPLPFLRALSPSSIVVVLSTDATGSFRATAPIGTNPTLMGATIFAQALTLTQPYGFEATNVAATTVAPGAASWSYLDRSSLVPAVAIANASGKGAARDLDSDGDPDLVLITGPNYSVHVFRNDGGFAFVDVTTTAIPAAATFEATDIEAFDADGDGRNDLLIIGGPGDPNGAPLPNVLLRNVGGLAFQSVPFPAVAGIARDIAITDLDSDGDLDVVLANGNDGVHSSEVALPNSLLVNQGFAQGGIEGSFAADAAFESAAWNGAAFNTCVAVGDIDNDGDDDIFFGRSDSSSADGTPGQPNLLVRNEGGLTFSEISTSNFVPLLSDNTAGARFGDVDGDGWLDLMVANSTVSVKSANSGDFYRNGGFGVFYEDNAAFPQVDESEIALRVGVHLVDVDLDGDLDVLHSLHEFFDFDQSTGAQTGGDDLLFVNQGGAQGGVHGNFALDLSFTKTGVFVTADAIHADFDLDGDDDLFVSCLGGLFGPPIDSRLLENTRIP